MSGEWIRAVLTVLGGALAGGLTNRVAIWMLFHPYEPPRVAGRRIGWLQGAIPRNRGRLARSIGRAVGDRLLTADDLAEALGEAPLREAFRERLEAGLERALRDRHPAPAEVLPPPALEELEGLVADLLRGLRPRLADLLASERFGPGARRVLADLADLLEERGGEPADDAAVDALRRRLDGWLEELAASEAFRDAVRRELDRAARRLLRPGRTLEEVIPDGAAGALEAAVRGYLPLAMERLGRLLEDPDARERFQAAVDDLLQRFMRDLRFHQRVVARLVVTEETVDRVVDTLEEEGTERLGELLREEEVQAAMARSVNDAVGELLRRPAAEVLGGPDTPRVRRAVEAAADWIVRTARAPEARGYLLDRIEEAARRPEGLVWSDLLRRLPAGRLGDWLAALLRSEQGAAALDAAADRLAAAVLRRPVGAPGRLLGEEASGRLADLLAPRLWRWIADEVPAVAEEVPVARKVEEKLRDFPMEEVEALVRSVSQRELDLIVRLGYLLGAVVGALLVGVTSLTS